MTNIRRPSMIRLTLIILIAITAMLALIGCGGGGNLISPQSYVSEYQSTGADHVLLDVRTPQEFASGHIEGAVNIAVEELEYRLSEVPADKEIIVYCQSGRRSAIAADTLEANGYTVRDLGGVINWTGAGYALVTE